MTPEQITAILTIIGSIITTIGTVVIAIYSLWSQQRQELRRAAQQRTWQEGDRDLQRQWSNEDRNLGRKWNNADRQIDQRKQFLLAHRGPLEDYVKHVRWLTDNLSQAIQKPSDHSDLAYLTTQVDKIYEHISSAEFHVAVLNDASLRQANDDFGKKALAFTKLALATLRGEPQADVATIVKASQEVVLQGAVVTARLEECVVNRLDDKGWE